MMVMYLPHALVQRMNGRVANWFRTRGELLLSDEYDPEYHAEMWVAEELDSEETINEDEYAEIMEDKMTDHLYEMIHDDASGRELLRDIGKTSEAFLYKKDSPLRETLLCTLGSSYAFMPLNYTLAKLLSPADTKLKVFASDEYSVVVDERRDIVFDNFWYFVGRSASAALEASRDWPQLMPSCFDYSLGGLAN